jgi:hypothetical protein
MIFQNIEITQSIDFNEEILFMIIKGYEVYIANSKKLWRFILLPIEDQIIQIQENSNNENNIGSLSNLQKLHPNINFNATGLSILLI